MGYRVLVVEDEMLMREIVVDFFKASGYSVFEAADGKEALDILNEIDIDVIILDIMLPEIDGWSVCQSIRKKSSVPIILVTARAGENDKLKGYEIGADDYITKPFSPKVLMAKTKNLLMRTNGTLGGESEANRIEVEGIYIDKDLRIVEIDGERTELSLKEFELLVYLIENENRVVSRNQIINNIWGYDYFGDICVEWRNRRSIFKK